MASTITLAATRATPVYPRTQYAFDLSGVKFKSRSDILKMQRQWETFERVENYNDAVYQKLLTGDRSTPYYFFRDNEELKDYRNGQELHVLRYPTLPSGTFASISSRPMPDVAIVARPPEYSMSTAPRGVALSTATTASETTTATMDMTIYTYVSSYNGSHVFKYSFASDDEKMAYHRAERRIRMGGAGGL